MPGQPQPPNDPAITTGALQVLEAGAPSNLIIESNTQFQLAMGFTLSGALATSLTQVPGGNFRFQIRYFFEGLGNLPEGQLALVNRNTNPNQLAYAAPLTSSVAVTPAAAGMTPGTYKLTGVVGFTLFGARIGIVGFTDGPIIQVI